MDKKKCDEYWEQFHSALDEIGIVVGDILYVSSDSMKILATASKELGIRGKEERDVFLHQMVNALCRHVGEGGTILFPVYSWAFCKGQPFDYRKTPGEVGALNNFVLLHRPDFVRTRHPMYSFMVWGRYAEELYQMNNQDAWGEGSPFAFLHRMGAKELGLSLPLVRTLTFKHYVEQAVRVPYRYPKYFLSHYIDENGVDEVRSYSMLVRDLSVKLSSCQELDFFLERGSAKRTYACGWEMFSLEYAAAFDQIKEDFLHNHGRNFYHFEDDQIHWETERNCYEIGFLKNADCLSVEKNDD